MSTSSDQPKRRSSAWSESDIENALEELAEGHGLHRTASKYNIPPSTLSDRRGRVIAGLKGPKKCWTEKDLALAIEELQHGGTKLKLVSQKYKIPEVTLRSKLKKLNAGIDVFENDKIVVKRKLWSEADAKKALSEIIEGGERITHAARKYGIPPSTLHERYYKLQSKKITSELKDMNMQQRQTSFNFKPEMKAEVPSRKLRISKRQLYRRKNNAKTPDVCSRRWTDADLLNAFKELSKGAHPADTAFKYRIPLTTLKRRRDAFIAGRPFKRRRAYSSDKGEPSVDSATEKSELNLSNEESFEASSKIQSLMIGAEYEVGGKRRSTNSENTSLVEIEITSVDGAAMSSHASSPQYSPPASPNSSNFPEKTFTPDMIEKLKHSKNSVPKRTWTEEDLICALEDLSDGGKASWVAAKYGIPLTTLNRRREMLMMEQHMRLKDLSQTKSTSMTPIAGRKSAQKRIRMLLSSRLRDQGLLDEEESSDGRDYEASDLSTSFNNDNGFNKGRAQQDDRVIQNEDNGNIKTLSDTRDNIANMFSSALRQQQPDQSVPNVVSSNSADSLFFSLICLEMEQLPKTKKQQFKQNVLKLLHESLNSSE